MQNTWNLEIRFEEDESRTAATAALRLPGGGELRGHGYSRRNPRDPARPAIGEEVAAARALSNLAHELIEKAATHIEESTHEQAHLKA